MTNTAFNLKKILKNIGRVFFPLLLGGSIMYWMYRGFDWNAVRETITQQMQWGWILLSLPFGIFAQVLRGGRWKISLDPLHEPARTTTCVDAVFISYMASLVIPRIGEVMRCGLLKKRDDVSFVKSLGTVVTERIVDALCMILIAAVTLLLQVPVFTHFFRETGTNMNEIFGRFTSEGYWVTFCCGVAALILGYWLIRRFAVFQRVRSMVKNLLEGIFFIKELKSLPLYITYSVSIWVCYFFHFYLTFFAFGFTEHLGLMAGLVSFVVGTIAVIVPTPNGAGPWHFAVKTILVLYGVSGASAAIFALIVHSIQTLLILLIGIYGIISMQFVKIRPLKSESEDLQNK